MKLVRFEKDGRVATGALMADGATIVDFQLVTWDKTRFPLSMSAFLARGAA